MFKIYNYNKMSISKKITFGFLFINITIMIFLFVIYYNQISLMLINQLEKNNEFILENFNLRISEKLKNYTDILYRLGYNLELREIMNYEYNDIEINDKKKLELDQLKKMVSIYDLLPIDPSINQIKIYFRNDRIYTENSYKFFTFNDAKNETWYNEINKVKDEIIITQVKRNLQGSYPDIPVISIVRAIIDKENSNKQLAIIEIELNVRMFLSKVLSSALSQNIYIIGEDGNIVFCLDSSLLGKNLYELYGVHKDLSKDNLFRNNEKLFFEKSIPNTTWHTVVIESLEDFNTELVNTFSRMMSILIIIFIIMLALIKLMSSIIENRIKKLLDVIRMSNNKNTDEHNIGDISIKDEFLIIEDLFTQMNEKNQYLTNEIYKMQLQKYDAQLIALQAQINPHFLYNILDTINWISLKENNKMVSNIVQLLAKFYRNRLSDNNNQLITIEDEIDNCKIYVQLENIRFGDTINLNILVIEDIKKMYIMNFILQPILENCIKHGILTKPDMSGTITIKAFVEQNKLVITIEDDGEGISEDISNKLNNGISVSRKGTGYGFQNVRNRIKMNFGNDYDCAIYRGDSGTLVRYELPIINRYKNI